MIAEKRENDPGRLESMSRRPKAQLVRLPVPTPPRETPTPPPSLGAEGLAAWEYVWRQPWIAPDRHALMVQRYCAIQDLMAAARAQIERDGLMVAGSLKQQRIHPLAVELRLLSVEARLTEVELGLTPGSASRAGADRQLPSDRLDAMMARQRERGA